MNGTKVIEIYSLLKQNLIQIWIDGGWGIDALLKKQTRSHSDLDIVIEKENVKKSIEVLKKLGFERIPKDDTRPWNFVLGNSSEHIDYHVIEFDKLGRGIYGPFENGVYYPEYAFGWTGIILETEVMCISPKYQVESHLGYKLEKKDYYDVKNICEEFEIPIPDDYNIFN